MKTNLKAYNKWKLKRKSEANDSGEAKQGRGSYFEDLRKSENFEVGDYPVPWVAPKRFPGDRLQCITGISCVAKIYDSSHATHGGTEQIQIDELLCFSRLAMAFYNIRMGTHFCVVKLLMATNGNPMTTYDHYITFEAERDTGDSVTFQTKILFSNRPFYKIKILFVRIKSDHYNSQPSDIDHNAQVIEYHTRLSQVINTYTIGSTLDSQYSLALYLSQFAVFSYNSDVLRRFDVAKHDIESIKVLNLVKLDSEAPTYVITFEASVHAENEWESVELFKTEICMPTLFPTTTIELMSEARVLEERVIAGSKRAAQEHKTFESPLTFASRSEVPQMQEHNLGCT